MRENGTDGRRSEDTSASSFVVIDGSEDSAGSGADGGDGSGGGGGDGDRRRFARTLDSKLKKLQRHHGGGGKSHASRKPVFVTTVKTGIFLDPPPDLAALLGLDDHRSSSSGTVDSVRYYSYSSKPRVLYDKQHQLRTSAAAAAAARKTDRQPE